MNGMHRCKAGRLGEELREMEDISIDGICEWEKGLQNSKSEAGKGRGYSEE